MVSRNNKKIKKSYHIIYLYTNKYFIPKTFVKKKIIKPSTRKKTLWEMFFEIEYQLYHKRKLNRRHQKKITDFYRKDFDEDDLTNIFSKKMNF